MDFAKRRIIATQIASAQNSGGSLTINYRLPVYDLDSEAQSAIVPAAGFLPFGTFVPYGDSQALWSAANMLLIVDLP